MADPNTSTDEVAQALRSHFERSADWLAIEEIMEMTALEREVVGNALRRLEVEGRIDSIKTKDFPYPTQVKRYLF